MSAHQKNQYQPPTRLSSWGHLAEGDTVVGLNGSVATNVKHHGPYEYEHADGTKDPRHITTFNYDHPTDALWQGKTYVTPSIAPGGAVYRKS